ncbi:unnamed protein product [marine sediment metagenome]|uniref:Uncharacterized protein n=1 Tax=marine sediment metagenome TaxID=412755 RepID=X1APQ3_9ZZZZ
MEQVIVKIQELYKVLISTNEDNFERDKKLREDRAKLDGEIKSFELKSKDLNIREIDIKKVEDVIVLSERNKTEAKKIQEANAQLVVERNAFATYSEDTKVKNTELANRLQAELDECAKKKAELTEGLKVLEERKKNIIEEAKAEFDKQIFSKIKK